MPPIQVTIQLVGVFRIGRFREELRNYPASAIPQTIIDELSIPLPLLGTVLINGRHASLDQPLHDDDIVTLLPFLDGG